MYKPVAIRPGTSSFDIPASDTLDPTLFDGEHLRPEIRAHLLSLASMFLTNQLRLVGANEWLRLWIAGSGVSYRWHASAGQGPGDLDVLLGINPVAFRKNNPRFSGLSDTEIATTLNDQLREGLWPATKNWMSRYEVTWYVNPNSWDIQRINPYAAYDLRNDDWSVRPSRADVQIPAEWEEAAASYESKAHLAVGRYGDALDEVRYAQNPAHRRDAETRFNHAVDSAVALFDVVHRGRKAAFSPAGGGYSDFANYLWQHGKRHGWIPALREIHDYHRAMTASAQKETYGLELPDTDRLVARAAMYLQ